MGVTLTDVLLFGKAQSDDVDNATLVIYRRNIMRWSTIGGYLDIIVKGVAPLSLPDAIANSLSYVKAFGGTEQRNLPDNYIERQFIYMLGGSHIRVEDLPISAGYKVEFDFQTTSLSTGLRNYLGGRAAGVSAGGGFRLSKLAVSGNYNNNVVLYGFESGTEYYAPEQFQANTRYKYTYDNGVCTLESGGSVVSTRTFTVTDNTSTDWGINTYVTGSSYTLDSDGIYVYSLKIWNDQGELVMDLVPAIQKGTVPVVGFYDTVSGTFKTATVGTFAAGGEAVPTPDEPMDIVSNNGVLKLSPNLFKSSDITTTTVSDVTISVDSDGVITADGTSSGPNYSQFVFPLSNPISEGTYTVSLYNSETLSAGSLVGFAINTTVGARGTALTTANNVKTITVGSGEVCNNVIIRIAGTANQFKFKIQIEKGNQGTTYRPYGSIYTDGTVETINIHGKNLFDKNHLPERIYAYFSSSGTTWTYTSAGQSFRFPCLPNTTYTARYNGDSAQAVLSFASASTDDVPTSSQSTVTVTRAIRQNSPTINTPITLTTGANDKWLIVQYNASDPQNTDMANNLQIEIGSTATTYEPYYDGGTATTEMLLKVGDYQDVQSIIDGVVTRNVGVEVLDGTENWTRLEASSGVPFATFNLALSTTAAGGISNAPRCSHFVSATSTGRSSIPDNGVGVTANSTYTTMWFRCDSITTKNDFTAWLADQYAAGTPVIILFALATPTTESVTGQTLQVTGGDNTLEITQASLTGLELEAKYQAAVSLTIQEVQDANLDPNVEVTIN